MRIHELRTCPNCGQIVSVVVKRPNHVLHALLSLMTGGFWIIVWLAAIFEASMSRGKVKCPRGCKVKGTW